MIESAFPAPKSIASTQTLDSIASRWDCLVIGGGLAGTLAARDMAMRGFTTLIVERKSFPRAKVCGACLNHRGISVLKSAGLAEVLDDCQGVPIDTFLLRGFGRQVKRSLPGGLAVSRTTLDAALMRAATIAGATCLTSTTAKVLPNTNESPHRIVRLNQQSRSVDASSHQSTKDIEAKVVIAADGLGHPSLRSLEDFTDRVSPRSRVGIGATIEITDETKVAPGSIQMAVSRYGYGGMVLVEAGKLNLAAAVNPAFLKGRKSADAFNMILTDAGFPAVDSKRARWIGTPSLSRTINRVAFDRVLTVGDAAGYVEPFTGEGMTWALLGGHSVATAASLMISGDVKSAARIWQASWGDLIYRRQKWCRRLAWVLRHPLAAKLGVAVTAKCPSMTNAIVNQLNLELSVRA